MSTPLMTSLRAQNKCVCVLLVIVLFHCNFANAQTSKANEQADAPLRDLLDRVWDFRLTESPELATNVGDPRGQDRLKDMSVQAIERRNQQHSQFFKEAEGIEPSTLNGLAKIDHELLRRYLVQQLAEFRFRTFEMPINNREGFHIEFPEMPRWMNPKSKQEVRDYTARLRAFDKYASDHFELLRLGIASGRTQPAIIMRDAVKQAESQVVEDVEKSLFITNLSDETQANLKSDDSEWQTIADELRDAITSRVVPGYQKFAKFLETKYLPACRETLAASVLPDGREFYRHCVKKFTTLDLSAEEVHAIGVRENARIREEMNAIREQVEFEGDLPEFLKYLRTDEKFYAKSAEALMQQTALILKKADGKLPEFFGRLPRIPYGLREVPSYVAPQTTSAYYWPPPTDGSRAGYYYLNTYNLSSRPLYQLESLSMHEAVPGHHLQLALQAEIQDLHPMSRQSSFTAFIEGWALYSERLGQEMGFYTDPYQDFGRLSMEAWRASRLVVDTGIHSMGWTRRQAIDYMRENTALSEHNIVAEVDRYIGWPGQALAYKIGELEISRLRREAEQKLGDDFDLRSFHDRVLEAGSIPLPLLRQRVEEWISQQG